MKFIVKFVLLLGLVVTTTQDINGRKGCDCSICNGVNNKISPLVGKKLENEEKSSCNICEQRKEMIRLEKERQKKLQKCPFDILGAPAIKGKTSEEIFDEFREIIVPSQNGFFDMMRGIVKTMHVSSEMELKWAKEKEKKELAKKLQQMREQERMKLLTPEEPVMVIVEQPQPGIVSLNAPEKLSFVERFAKEAKDADYMMTTEKTTSDYELANWVEDDKLTDNGIEDNLENSGHDEKSSGEQPRGLTTSTLSDYDVDKDEDHFAKKSLLIKIASSDSRKSGENDHIELELELPSRSVNDENENFLHSPLTELKISDNHQ